MERRGDHAGIRHAVYERRRGDVLQREVRLNENIIITINTQRRVDCTRLFNYIEFQRSLSQSHVPVVVDFGFLFGVPVVPTRRN